MCESKNADKVKSVDTRRCFSGVLLNNTTRFNIFSAFAYVQPFTYDKGVPVECGEYYVSRDFHMGRGTIFVSKGFYPLNIVRHAIQRNYIAWSDVTQCILADRSIPATAFQHFVKDVISIYPDESNLIVNHFIGCLGSLFRREVQAGVTQDLGTALATMEEFEKQGSHGQLYKSGDVFILQNIKETMKDFGDVPIHRQIIAGSLINLDLLVEAVQPQEIVCFNTDCVKFRGTYNAAAVKPKQLCGPGDYHLEDKEVILSGRPLAAMESAPAYEPIVSKLEAVDEEEKDDERLISKGGMVLGMPGCGKTHLVKTLIDRIKDVDPESIRVITYTCSASENLKEREVQALNLHSLAWKNDRLVPEAFAGAKFVILDEFVMMPPDEMAVILVAQQRYGFVFIALGDPEQCKAPVTNWIAYEKNPVFQQMCGNYQVTLTYKGEGAARYDKALYEALLDFLKTRSLRGWEKSEVPSYVNLCYHNYKRKAINKACLQRWLKENGKTLTTTCHKEGPVCVGLPVMVYHKHNKELGLFKTQIWTVTAIRGDSVSVERVTNKGVKECVTVPKKVFKELFDYCFATTIHKCQGRTIDQHYNIYEADHLTADILYTAISRGTKRKYVHIVGFGEGPFEVPERPLVIETNLQQVELKWGYIYRVDLSDGSVYIGETEKEPEERLEQHRAHPANPEMAALLDDSATVTTLARFLFSDKARLRAQEEKHIAQALNAGLLLRNVKHNRPAKAVEPVTAEAAPAKKPRIRIGEDKAKKRYEIRFQREGKVIAHQRFPWGSDKEAAYKRAEALREQLLATHF
jgi:predicted GIY-YIG superfamily endonuclease